MLFTKISSQLEKKMSKLFSAIRRNSYLVTFLGHAKVLLTDLDPIKELPVDFPNSHELLAGNWDVLKDEKSKRHGKINVHNLFPTLVTLFIALDCLLVFHQNNWQYSYTGMPQFLFHYIFPYEYLILQNQMSLK